MLLGNVCTRRCGFCAIETGRGEAIDIDEPERVAESVAEMGLEYVVLTSVARDDLRDEGAGHIAETIRAIRRKNSAVSIEVLTPDFHARPELIRIVLNAEPTVFNHNLECVRRLQKSVRPQADYDRSLRVLETVKLLDPGMTVKSGLMLGLGENLDEVRSAVTDLRRSGCDILTLGQYLPPSVEHLPVQEYVAPSIFDALAEEFKKLGFRNVFAGPYVRSSYHAGETYLTIQGG